MLRSRVEEAVTLERFVLREERFHDEASGELSNIILSLATAAKAISCVVRRGGLPRLQDAPGKENKEKLTVTANRIIIRILKPSRAVCALITKLNEDVIEVEENQRGSYIVAFNPVDGSSNIDCLVSIGTVFSVFKKVTPGPVTEKDLLQSGRNVAAAGYVIYGSATSLVFSTGNGVDCFALDPTIGEFMQTHSKVTVPNKGAMYSINEAYSSLWPRDVAAFVEARKKGLSAGGRRMSHRYIGTLVADFNRTMLYGGIFMYPAMADSPKGKLRLLYEVVPMAYIMVQAGGLATNGKNDLLDVQPSAIHERSPLICGSRDDVEQFLQYAKD